MDREAGSTWTETGRTWTDTGNTIKAGAELEEDEVTADILILGAGMAGISAAKGSHQSAKKGKFIFCAFRENDIYLHFFNVWKKTLVLTPTTPLEWKFSFILFFLL